MKVFQPVGSKLCKPKPNFLEIEKFDFESQFDVFSEAFQFIITEKCYIQKHNPFVTFLTIYTLCLCYRANLK